jgi:hypothetical protein
VLVIVDGERRVDPKSVPDWSFSAVAWEDHETVRKAVEDRWAEEQRKARQFENIARAREAKRAEIVSELEAGRLIARREKGEWVITGSDSDLVFIARKWRDHADLIAAFLKGALEQESAPKPLSQMPSPRPQPSATKAHQPARAATPITPASPLPLSPAPVEAYTLAQQQWMRDRQPARPGR